MKLCVVGHIEINVNEKLKNTLKSFFEDYILNKNYTTFLFGSSSEFDSLCYDIITELKEKYEHIKRIHYLSYDIELNESKFGYLKFYEDVIVPVKVHDSGKLAYIKRNEAMIDDSDFCLFYFDKNYIPLNCKNVPRKSGTKLAMEYAEKNKKKFTNILELIEK